MVESEIFRIWHFQGVSQGGLLSADIYKVYVDDLLKMLNDSDLGLKKSVSTNPTDRPFFFFLCGPCNFYCLPEKNKNKKIFIPTDPKCFRKLDKKL